jgi:hypothetical protein
MGKMIYAYKLWSGNFNEEITREALEDMGGF